MACENQKISFNKKGKTTKYKIVTNHKKQLNSCDRQVKGEIVVI